MSDQPDTFASVKKRWRNAAQLDRNRNAAMQERMNRGETVTMTCSSGPYVDPRETFANELESGLEQRVRELRDDCFKKADFCDTNHNPEDCHCGTAYKVMATKLTALLGEPNERT